MRPVPQRFPDVTAADLRAIQRLTGQLIEASDLTTLGRELIRGAEKFLPADFLVWNQWSLPMDLLFGFEANHEHFHEALAQRSDELIATIHHHPIIAAGNLDLTKIQPQRMSDYQSDAAFKSNPLFQEVYRHLESNHQMAYSAVQLEDSQIILSWNRRQRDFSGREMQLLHVLGRQVALLSRRIEERQYLQSAWQALRIGLEPFTGNTTADPLLAARDGRILADLISGKPRIETAISLRWRRDTLDRHLATLRERLGHENSAQLMRALAELKAPQNTGGQPSDTPHLPSM